VSPFAQDDKALGALGWSWSGEERGKICWVVRVVYAGSMNEVMYYTYIVASRSHNFYVGMTSDIESRVWQHKNGVFEGHSMKYNCN
jgi:hypothetical protein